MRYLPQMPDGIYQKKLEETMFGYITVNQPELKIKHYNRYRSYYCGLCQALGERYGRIGQATLTYDMTFLVILLTGLYETPGTTQEHRCIAHPAKKHTMFRNACSDYAADMNILLAYHNCMDDWFDDKNLVKLSTAKLLEKKYNSLEQTYPRQVRAMESYIRNVHKSEKANLDDLDQVSGYTGKLLGELFVWKEDEWSGVLRRMGFFLGKFIYLMDAYDDLNRDEKKRHYNPWSFYKDRPDFQEYCKSVLTMMMAECAGEFERLPILLDAEILRNILYSGIWTKYDILVKNKKKKQENEK